MRVRTELYHKAISVESPGQGALSNRELESLTRGFQTSPQNLERKKPETSEEGLLKLLSRGAEFQLESRPGPKRSRVNYLKSPGQELLRLEQEVEFLYPKRKHPLPRPRPGNQKPTLLESSEELFLHLLTLELHANTMASVRCKTHHISKGLGLLWEFTNGCECIQ